MDEQQLPNLIEHLKIRTLLHTETERNKDVQDARFEDLRTFDKKKLVSFKGQARSHYKTQRSNEPPKHRNNYFGLGIQK